MPHTPIRPFTKLPPPVWECHGGPSDRPCPECARERRADAWAFAMFMVGLAGAILYTLLQASRQ